MASLVGIVVRTADRPEFLRRALADIGRQSFTDFTVLVVNDGAMDDDVATVIADSDVAQRSRVVKTLSPGGRCTAANTGIRQLDTAYIVLHDDDDLWDPQFLARTVAYLEANPADAGVAVSTEIVYEREEDGSWVPFRREPFWQGLTAITFTSLLEINRAVPISFLYRRAVHDEIGYYDEALDAVEDWEFYLRLTAKHPVGFLTGAPLAYWMQRPGVAGAEGNSMFELASMHERDDLAVRDAALRKWVADNGAGLPLYMARALAELRIDVERRIDDRARALLVEMYDAHPLWGRLRRLRRRFQR